MRKAGADKNGVVELVAAIERAWNLGDVKSYARLYAEDAEYLTRAGILWSGRKAIERGHAAAFRGDLKGSTLKIGVKRIRIFKPGAAAAWCAIELTEGGGKRGRKIRAVTTFALRKNRGRWEIEAARTRKISSRRR
ncbi:MAG: SgcJ/EcaC family oxidoreductase [Candidatus Acidiferrales bacterium]